MKVFFLASYRGTKHFADEYQKIYEGIFRLGYQHIDDEVVNTTYEMFLKKGETGKSAYVNHYKNKVQSIMESDICVFETSSHSLRLGFLIDKALENSKPTIVLHRNDHVPYFLSGAEHEKLIVRSYDPSNVYAVLRDSLNTARERRDKRFNFFLSPKLLDYLEATSAKMGISKSKLIRDLIVKRMRKDAEEKLAKEKIQEKESELQR